MKKLWYNKSMILIFGLGNIGDNYKNTYHNIGFKTVDAFLKANNLEISKRKYQGDFLETNFNGEKVIFVKPTTFMNNSGDCVLNFMKKFKATVDDILVIYDDYDLLVGEVRFRKDGSAGTHNGMRDIVKKLNSENFKRLRIGINNGKKIPILDYVLSKIKEDESFDKVFEKTNEFLIDYIKKSGKVENTSFKIWLAY